MYWDYVAFFSLTFVAPLVVGDTRSVTVTFPRRPTGAGAALSGKEVCGIRIWLNCSSLVWRYLGLI